MKEDLFCGCGHPQSFHARGVGRCEHGCGCERVNLHRRGVGVELLELLDPGEPPRRAPTYRVRCPACKRTYESKSWARDIVARKSCRRCSDERRRRRKNPDAGASRPKDMPPATSFADRPHGTRLRYVAGCHCDSCREANTAYERLRGKLRRAGQGDPLVAAARVRRHIERLSRAGVGRRTVADIAGVPHSSISELRRGTKKKLRKSTAARILAVGADALTDAKLVPAASTWKLLERLLEEGYTRGAIALRLGMKKPALQLRKDRVTARTRARVERLYQTLMGQSSEAA